ncbi:MAG: hypothetical protein O7C67_20680 [Gammaproteobacteria bacterium]|nr:hypothetical protein [Gammaproteobacteria bacterium]
MKVVAWIVGLVVLTVGGAIVYVALNSGAIMKRAVEAIGQEVLGTSVEVDAVNLSMAEGSGEIRGLEIGNPVGFEGDYSMRFSLTKVVLEANDISEELVVIKQVIIDGADIAAEVQGQRSNLQALLDNVASATDPDVTTGVPEPKIIIDRFDFTNARASVTSDLVGNAEFDVPDVHLTGVGRKSDGITAAEAVAQMLRPIAQAVIKQLVAEGLGVDDLQEAAQQRLRDKVDEEIGSELKSIIDRFGHPD